MITVLLNIAVKFKHFNNIWKQTITLKTHKIFEKYANS